MYPQEYLYPRFLLFKLSSELVLGVNVRIKKCLLKKRRNSATIIHFVTFSCDIFPWNLSYNFFPRFLSCDSVTPTKNHPHTKERKNTIEASSLKFLFSSNLPFYSLFCLYKDSVFVDIEHHRCSFEFLSVIVQYSLPYRKEHNCLGFFSLFIRTFSDLLIISSLSEKHFCLLIWTFRCHTLHRLLQHYSHR